MVTRIITTSVRLVTLSGVFAVFHFKTGLHLLKDKTLGTCFFKRKPEINRKGQDTTLSLTCIAI